VIRMTANGLAEGPTFQADGEITAGPVAGPGGQVLVGTANGTLYSLTEDLGLRWQRNIGAPVQSVPAFSADALHIVSQNTLWALNPFSGAPVWSRDLGGGAESGSVAIGYGREVYAQTSGGKVVAYGEGWSLAPLLVLARTVVVEEYPAIEIEWVLVVAPVSGQAQPTALTTLDTSPGILLQRRAGDGDWEDVAILSPETTVYHDNEVLDGTAYAYRVQVFGEEGNDSDFTTTLVDVESLPALPGAPKLTAVTVEGADALGLEWSPREGDVVSGYRIERSLSKWGFYTTTLQTSGQVTATIDTGLVPGQTYYYRVIAVNGTGESRPSNVVGGTTRQRTLSAPENATATLLEDGRIQIDWDPGPDGAVTEIEYIEGPMADFQPLATAGSTGPYSAFPGDPTTYLYRLRFVLGDTESDYTETPVVVVEQTWVLYLPLIWR